MVKKEFPFDPLDLAWRVNDPARAYSHPSQIEVLQGAPPYAALEESQEERIQLQDAVLDAFDQLDEWEIWLLNALLYERRSLREVERMLRIPKTTVARKRDYILRKLKRLLEKDPLVQEYLA
jgi:DNA-directed RNA polymerase specialized sigma subunit